MQIHRGYIFPLQSLVEQLVLGVGKRGILGGMGQRLFRLVPGLSSILGDLCVEFVHTGG